MSRTDSTIIVIADDLSGAAELAGIAFAHGLSAEVQRQFEAASDTQVIAVDTDSRSLSAAAAAERVKQVAARVVASQPAWIFKKVDSVLRGHVRAEIEATLSATRQPRAILVPANPSRGRTIAGGRYFISGVPLEQTAVARDPEHPRSTSDVWDLLEINPRTSAILVPDIEIELQVEQAAARCDQNTLAAGAADFFTALLRQRLGPRIAKPLPQQALFFERPALLVCGSRMAWPIRRHECAAARIPIITIDAAVETTPQRFDSRLLGIGDTQLPASNTTRLSSLAQRAASIAKSSLVKAILAEGGATAAAIAAEMKWTRFQVVATAPAGVGVLQPIGPNAPLFVIKPGSYPWPSDIWQAFCRC